MGYRRSNQDEVHKLSTSIFVTNFPEQFQAKDLWRVCNQYRTVIDTFIPNRISKAGKSHAVKRGNQTPNMEGESTPAIVLDETCMNEKDLSKSLMGKVKEFGSLSNLKVMIEFESEVSKEKFKTHVGVGSWFSQIQQASNEFHNYERVTWVDIEGMPLKEEEHFHSKRICIITKLIENIFESFKIIFKGKVFWIRAKEVPGWTPNFVEEEEEDTYSKGNLKDDGLDTDIVDKQKYAT
ncbi:nucleotide-binding alpha-beta plait domain-containing protein [Tanacetum coccineum]